MVEAGNTENIVKIRIINTKSIEIKEVVEGNRGTNIESREALEAPEEHSASFYAYANKGPCLCEIEVVKSEVNEGLMLAHSPREGIHVASFWVYPHPFVGTIPVSVAESVDSSCQRFVVGKASGASKEGEWKQLFTFYVAKELDLLPNLTTVVVRSMIERTLGMEAASHIDLRLIPTKLTEDIFQISESPTSENIIISGNSPVSVASGVNWYLKHTCKGSISWCGDNIHNIHNKHNKDISLPLPRPTYTERRTGIKVRYYLNYCTFCYSMCWWEWERWEREIDWMAMNGINTPLAAVIGQHKLWQNIMRKLEFDNIYIEKFLPGPAYAAWWQMHNLEGMLGPVSQEWIDKNSLLQIRILERMREYGMTPVLQGFYGMVPSTIQSIFPDANLLPCEMWSSFQRPGFLAPTSTLFPIIAELYYSEQKRLYGEYNLLGGDPFHESSISGMIDLKESGRIIYEEMCRGVEGAVWVLQAWGGPHQPHPNLLKVLNPGEALVLDLWAEHMPQWGGAPSKLGRSQGFLGHKWVWCALLNFGGKHELIGNLEKIATDIRSIRDQIAATSQGKQGFIGIGATMEGIYINPVIYDLLFEMVWRLNDENFNIREWVNTYVSYRYSNIQPAPLQTTGIKGIWNKLVEEKKEGTIEIMQKAWDIMNNTCYKAEDELFMQRLTVFCTVPCTSFPRIHKYYDGFQLLQAWPLFAQAAKLFLDSDTFSHDFVDFSRQMLGFYTNHLMYKVMKVIRDKKMGDKKKLNLIDKIGKEFEECLFDLDQLLSTRKEFLLGRWVGMAHRAGIPGNESDLFVKNAKYLISIWETEDFLADYAAKEWAGLIGDLYVKRWRIFFADLKSTVETKKSEFINYHRIEREWAEDPRIDYNEEPIGNPIEVGFYMFEKYYPKLNDPKLLCYNY